MLDGAGAGVAAGAGVVAELGLLSEELGAVEVVVPRESFR